MASDDKLMPASENIRDLFLDQQGLSVTEGQEDFWLANGPHLVAEV
jgi:hypothetical protein